LIKLCSRVQFSVLRYESVIHEYDPYFNYRATVKLVADGLYDFWDWFDHESWYPLGRVIGGTIYPGLMITAAAMHKILASITAVVSLRDVCVLTAPFFASNTVRHLAWRTSVQHDVQLGQLR
jgi:dolichyl-diphosphooligosaccharide---protein glycosyltransferase